MDLAPHDLQPIQVVLSVGDESLRKLPKMTFRPRQLLCAAALTSPQLPSLHWDFFLRD